jgi:hypothetical protein
MFQIVNGSRETMRESFLAIGGNVLAVVLAERDLTIYFSKTHIIDLRAILDAEQSLPPESAPEATDDDTEVAGGENPPASGGRV